jgi:predicted DNA-binding protein YlxM (UPF0122 family)
MDAFELYILLRKKGNYDYPYTQIADELNITRQSVWYECNGKPTSKIIREFVANKLSMKVEEIFPVKATKREAA